MSALPRPELEQQFARATELHRQGQLAAAEQAYQAVHAADRQHAGALAMLGTLALQRGRPADAVPWLRAALAQAPGNAAYWNNLGKASKDSGQLDAALEAYQRAVRLQPDNPNFLFNLANLQLESQQAEAAVSLYQSVLRHQPEHPMARKFLAVACFEAGNRALTEGRPGPALQFFDQALAIQPAAAEVHNNRGNALCELGEHAAAVTAFQASLALRPGVALVRANLAGALRHLDRHDEALAQCAAALERDPEHMAAWNNQGLVQLSLHQPQQALISFERARSLQPDSAEVAANRANALQALGRHAEALQIFESLLQSRPDHSDLLADRAAVLLSLDRPQEALQSALAACRLDPAHASACNNQVAVLRRLDRHDQALEVLDQALLRAPRAGSLHGNRGVVLNDLGRWQEALAAFDRASSLQPAVLSHVGNRASTRLHLGDLSGARADFEAVLARRPELAEVRMNLGMLDLSQGAWASGWQHYEARLAMPDFRNRYPQSSSAPSWDGRQALAGRTLLLWSEQGLGDTLQCVRLLELLPAAGAIVLLQVPEVLHGVLAGLAQDLPGAELRLTRPGDPVPPIDFQLSLLSLPHRLGLAVTESPESERPLRSASSPGAGGTTRMAGRILQPRARWLLADSLRCAEWQQRLGPRSRPRIGLVWSGNPRHINDRNRSLPLAELLAALPPHYEYHLVQKELGTADRAQLADHPELHWHGDALHDFSDTAALLSSLDHLVTVDTSVAHLAGGLGLPFSLLLPCRPDFRWMYGRSDSPWYPSARLYRQTTPRDWAPVLAAAFTDLGGR